MTLEQFCKVFIPDGFNMIGVMDIVKKYNPKVLQIQFVILPSKNKHRNISPVLLKITVDTIFPFNTYGNKEYNTIINGNVITLIKEV